MAAAFVSRFCGQGGSLASRDFCLNFTMVVALASGRQPGRIPWVADGIYTDPWKAKKNQPIWAMLKKFEGNQFWSMYEKHP